MANNPYQSIAAFTSDTSAWTFDGFGTMPVPQPNDYEPNKEFSGLLQTGAAYTLSNKRLGIKFATAQTNPKYLPLKDITGVAVYQGYQAVAQVTAISCSAITNPAKTVEGLIRIEAFDMRDLAGDWTQEEPLIFPAGPTVTAANVAQALIRQINANPYRKCTAALKANSTTTVLLTFLKPGARYDVTFGGPMLTLVPEDSVLGKPAFGNGEWLKAMRLGTPESAHDATDIYKVVVIQYQKDIVTHGNGAITGSLADTGGVQRINQIAYHVVDSTLESKLTDLSNIVTGALITDAEVKEYVALVDNLTPIAG